MSLVSSPYYVSDVDQDARDGARALGRVEDAHLVVGEVDAFEHREPGADGQAQGLVEGVDRAVALGSGDLAFAANVELDRGLGGERPVADLVGDHAERLHAEEVRLPSAGPPQQQLEGPV